MVASRSADHTAVSTIRPVVTTPSMVRPTPTRALVT